MDIKYQYKSEMVNNKSVDVYFILFALYLIQRSTEFPKINVLLRKNYKSMQSS